MRTNMSFVMFLDEEVEEMFEVEEGVWSAFSGADGCGCKFRGKRVPGWRRRSWACWDRGADVGEGSAS